MISGDILNLILSSFRNNRPIQSLLFIGPDGALKFSTIKELAKSLNCLIGSYNACNNCSNCKKIENLMHPDFHAYGLNSDHIKISDIHSLQKSINMRPYEAKTKIFAIRNADNLTNDAANCLLKTLEEPLEDSVIILTTSKLSKIFPTIISRCQKFYFGLADSNTLKNLSKDKDFKNKVINLVFVDNNLSKGFGSLEQKQEFKAALMIVLSVIRDILFLNLDAPKDDLINLDHLDLLLNIKNQFSFAGLLNISDELAKLSLNIEQNINLKLIFDVLLLRINENRLVRSILK
ncbi:MAG: DNA polymerase III subunit delta' C-terminal domain-containing protein [Candidatus Omnitrophota bacterium]